MHHKHALFSTGHSILWLVENCKQFYRWKTESGFTNNIRHSVDIDANWCTKCWAKRV